MTANTSTTATPEPISKSLSLRAILLLAWLACGNLWINRHLGIGWDEPTITLALAGIGAGFALAEAADKDLKKRLLARVFNALITPLVLISIYVIFIGIAAAWSSVTILSEPPGTATSVSLAPLSANHAIEENNLSDPSKPVRFLHTPTSPFGKSYVVSVKGFVPSTFQVLPLTGLTINPRTDLQVAPSVLFRPSDDVLGPMAGGVRIRLFEQLNGKDQLVMEKEHVHKQSILVGSTYQISPAAVELWRLELQQKGLTNARLTADILQSWRSPLLLETTMKPNALVHFVICNAAQEAIADTLVRLTNDRFQDYVVHPVSSATGGCL